MKFIFSLVFFLILAGTGASVGVYYFNDLNSQFQKEKTKLEKKIKDKTIMFEQKLSSYDDYESELSKRYDDKKDFVDKKYDRLVAVLKRKYGEYDKFKMDLLEKYSDKDKDLKQREKSLKIWEDGLIIKEQEANLKDSLLSNINLECKIFDKKKLEKYLRAYHLVSYATLNYISMACGTNVQGQMVNSQKCFKSKKDRVKAKSLLMTMDTLSSHVANGVEYRTFVKKANTIMNFN